MAREPHVCLWIGVTGRPTILLLQCHRPIAPCCSSSSPTGVQSSPCPPPPSQLVDNPSQAPPSHGEPRVDSRIFLTCRPAKMTRGGTTAPSWGPVTKPAHRRLTSRTLKGTVKQTPNRPGPEPLPSPQDIRSLHHSGPRRPPLLPGVTAALSLAAFPGRPVLSERLTCWSRRTISSPACPSSGGLLIACCPMRCPRVPRGQPRLWGGFAPNSPQRGSVTP